MYLISIVLLATLKGIYSWSEKRIGEFSVDGAQVFCTDVYELELACSQKLILEGSH